MLTKENISLLTELRLAMPEVYERLAPMFLTEDTVVGNFIRGSVDLSNLQLATLPDLSRFVITGTFDCSGNELPTLQGSPHAVLGSYICRNNKLVNLVGGPKKVYKAFDCRHNKLETLVGGPTEVEGEYNCMGNKLTNLKGAPSTAESILCCFNNLSPEIQLKEMSVFRKYLKILQTLYPEFNLEPDWLLQNLNRYHIKTEPNYTGRSSYGSGPVKAIKFRTGIEAADGCFDTNCTITFVEPDQLPVSYSYEAKGLTCNIELAGGKIIDWYMGKTSSLHMFTWFGETMAGKLRCKASVEEITGRRLPRERSVKINVLSVDPRNQKELAMDTFRKVLKDLQFLWQFKAYPLPPIKLS